MSSDFLARPNIYGRRRKCVKLNCRCDYVERDLLVTGSDHSKSRQYMLLFEILYSTNSEPSGL
jgi:hypothetical protein